MTDKFQACSDPENADFQEIERAKKPFTNPLVQVVVLFIYVYLYVYVTKSICLRVWAKCLTRFQVNGSRSARVPW